MAQLAVGAHHQRRLLGRGVVLFQKNHTVGHPRHTPQKIDQIQQSLPIGRRDLPCIAACQLSRPRHFRTGRVLIVGAKKGRHALFVTNIDRKGRRLRHTADPIGDRRQKECLAQRRASHQPTVGLASPLLVPWQKRRGREGGRHDHYPPQPPNPPQDPSLLHEISPTAWPAPGSGDPKALPAPQLPAQPPHFGPSGCSACHLPLPTQAPAPRPCLPQSPWIAPS